MTSDAQINPASTLTDDLTTIARALDALTDERITLARAHAILAHAQAVDAREDAKMALILSGEVRGKNQDERDAAMHAALLDFTTEVRLKRGALTLAQAKYDAQMMRFEAAKIMLLMEAKKLDN